jgi:hypothetical protein
MSRGEALSLLDGDGRLGFIARTYSGVYFTDDENRWLDDVAFRIHGLVDENRRALAYFALYQACLKKRPYNLFHRANLSMRLAEVKRGFGNKATWDKPFAEHFLDALEEANRAVFDNGRQHEALRHDFLDVPGTFDLVYMDPPYLKAGRAGVNYLAFYHFLEGLTEYPLWPSRITDAYKHKPYTPVLGPWEKRETILGAFDAAVDRYRDSLIAISYRDKGIPSIEELRALLKRHGRRQMICEVREYSYALSPAREKEVLLVSEPGSSRRA